MTGIEWVEVRARTVEEATDAALQELGLASPDLADIEVLEAPARGFLGMGGQDALVRVKPKQGGRRRRGRRGSSGAKGSNGGGKGQPRQGGGKGRQPTPSGQPPASGGKAAPQKRDRRPPKQAETPREDDRLEMSVEEQARELERFLTGLLDALGLDGEVKSRTEEGVIYVDVVGEQTEALVGPKGSVLQATLELCRTIIQRRVQAGARIRLDIAGYNERRREALRIYAQRLGERVLEDGGEIMLEPMNSAERKVVHDTIAEIDGVRSFSEGEEPRRSVVVAAEEAEEAADEEEE